MSTRCSLFILSPNGKNNFGLNRDVYIPNPSARSPLELAQFEFVGMLIGCALRARFSLPLALSSTFWKQLVEEPLDASDLEGIDRLCMQSLDKLQSISQMEFQEWFDTLTFQTTGSDGREIELKTGGAGCRVSHDQRLEFCHLALQARLEESSIQCQAVRKGFHQVVSPALLSLFDWRDVETLVCGVPTIDIELLKANTNYVGLRPTSSVVVWFWQALQSFDTLQRRAFLRFVWGRTRLPLQGDWDSTFTLKYASNLAPDSLPHASTCFFSLDLPHYPSYDVLRAKLLYSITHCVAIDADFMPATLSTLT